jgi:hypothetical protein
MILPTLNEHDVHHQGHRHHAADCGKRIGASVADDAPQVLGGIPWISV